VSSFFVSCTRRCNNAASPLPVLLSSRSTCCQAIRPALAAVSCAQQAPPSRTPGGVQRAGTSQHGRCWMALVPPLTRVSLHLTTPTRRHNLRHRATVRYCTYAHHRSDLTSCSIGI
jgi:hypothetical protein